MTALTHLGDMPIETFLKEYWQKKPLLIRNAFPDFTPPVSADELAGLALEEDIESRLIKQSADGSHWQLEHGPFTEEQFTRLPDSHWTLLVQAVDHWVPDVAPLLQQFSFIPGWRMDDLMISYAADGGGVGPHYDNYDVFLLQASGTRRWEVGGIFGEDSPRRADTPVMILPEWQAEESWDLQPGDMLYLPPRVGHNGYAVGADCMTYSIGFRAPSHQDILDGFAHFLSTRLRSEDRYADPDLTLQDNPGEINSTAIQRVQQVLQQYSNNTELLAEWFGRYMTESKYPDLSDCGEEEIERQDIADLLQSGASLCRNEGARFAFYKQQQLTLFVDGASYPCTEAQEKLAEQLCAQPELQPDVTPENIELLLPLCRNGSLYFNE